MKRTRPLAAVLTAAALLLAPVAGAAPATAATAAERIAGTNQYETAIAVSQRMVSSDPANYSTRTAIIVSGSDGTDVLPAPMIARDGAVITADEVPEFTPPILMVRTGQGLEPNVEAELRRLQLLKVYIIGGTNRVSRSVEDRVRTFVPDVERVAGADRYETAARVSQRYNTRAGGSVWVVTGENNLEAVGGLGAATYRASSLLLTKKASLPASTAAELRRVAPSEVVVVGNTGVISAAVEKAIKKLVPTANVVRLAGPDRYATNLATVKYIDASGFNNLVSGETWQNALVATAYGSSTNAESVTLLTKKACVPGATLDYTGGYIDIIIGGPGNVSEAAASLKRC